MICMFYIIDYGTNAIAGGGGGGGCLLMLYMNHFKPVRSKINSLDDLVSKVTWN